MADQEIINALIATYRELNHKVRAASLPAAPVDVDRASEDSLDGLLLRLRNRELNASQAIKGMVSTADHMTIEDDESLEIRGAEIPITGELTPAILLSQFGTAREATLSLVRNLPAEEWDKTYPTPRGEMTLRQYLQTLVDRDRERMRQIERLLTKSPA